MITCSPHTSATAKLSGTGSVQCSVFEATSAWRSLYSWTKLFLLFSSVPRVQYFSSVYKCAVKTNKKGILMCIFGGFILFLILNGIWYFSLQVHCLEILVLHKMCLSILVDSSLFSVIVLAVVCEAQQTFFGLYPSYDLVMCCFLYTFLQGIAEQTWNKSN